MRIKLLDRYILKQFLVSLAGSMIFMIGLFLISIFIDNLRYFSNPQVSTTLIFKYIINIIPEVISQVLPAAALFSTSYVFGNLNATNEIVAIYNGGIGFTRVMMPLIYTGIILAISSFLFFEFISADCSNHALEIRNTIRRLSGKTLDNEYSRSDVFLMGEKSTVYYIRRFSGLNDTMLNPVITRFSDTGTIEFQLVADEGLYNRDDSKWTFKKVTLIKFEKGILIEEKLDNFSIALYEKPEVFKKSPRNVMQMRLMDALNFIEAKKRIGAKYRRYLVEFQWRFAFPFSIIIVILIGSIAGIFFRKSVVILSFFMSIVISFGYYGLMALGLAFGKSGRLSPVIAAWMANAVFIIIGMIAFRLKR